MRFLLTAPAFRAAALAFFGCALTIGGTCAAQSQSRQADVAPVASSAPAVVEHSGAVSGDCGCQTSYSTPSDCGCNDCGCGESSCGESSCGGCGGSSKGCRQAPRLFTRLSSRGSECGGVNFGCGRPAGLENIRVPGLQRRQTFADILQRSGQRQASCQCAQCTAPTPAAEPASCGCNECASAAPAPALPAADCGCGEATCSGGSECRQRGQLLTRLRQSAGTRTGVRVRMQCNEEPACQTCETEPATCDTCQESSCDGGEQCRSRNGLFNRTGGGLLGNLASARNTQQACGECGQSDDCGCAVTEAVTNEIPIVQASRAPRLSRSTGGLLGRLRARRPSGGDCQCEEGTDCGCDDAPVVEASCSDCAATGDAGCTECAAGGVGGGVGAIRARLTDNRIRVIDRARNAAGTVRGAGAGLGSGLGLIGQSRFRPVRGFGGIGCGRGGCGVGGLGLCPTCRADFAATVGGEIPHTALNPYGPGAGPGQAPQYVYPYYTTRGPRDFLTCEPPSIGY